MLPIRPIGIVIASAFIHLNLFAADLDRTEALHTYGRLPLSFQEVSGAPHTFEARGLRYRMNVSSSGARFWWNHDSGKPVTMRLAGALESAAASGRDRLSANTNYFLGAAPNQWRIGTPTFAQVDCGEIYQGITLLYYGNQQQLEYDFRVRPGFSPSTIRMSYSGIRGARVDTSGDLLLATAQGELRQQKPRIYQENGGIAREIAGKYVLRGRNTVGFEVGPYDRDKVLVIDPILTYATYIGGGQNDRAMGVGLDGAGNIYVGGYTTSTNLAVTPGAAGAANQGNSDIFVAKFTPKGVLVYLTYLGGNDQDLLGGMAVDKSGNVTLTGATASTNFPTVTPLQPINRGGGLGYDGFVTKLDPTGAKLIYSTYLGGNGDDLPMAIAQDASGNVYLTGTTSSVNYPVTSNPYQVSNHGLLNAFVTKISPTGSTLVYSTYVGGTNVDSGDSIAVDSSGNAYIAGDTASTDFPTSTGAIQTVSKGGEDVFTVKLNQTGTALLYSTLLGGTQDDQSYGIAVDSGGNAYVTGYTTSADFPVTKGVVQSTLSGAEDAFVAKIGQNGTTLVYSTLLGGTRVDAGYAITVDAGGFAHVAGATSSTNFPVVAPFQQAAGGGADAFVVKLDPNGAKIVQSSYLGRSGDEEINAIALDGAGNLYVAGETDTVSFPTTTGAAQSIYGGGDTDSFFAMVSFSAAATTITVAPNSLSFQGAAGASIAAQKLTVTAASGAQPSWTAMVATTSGGNWLSISQGSGFGTASITVNVNADSLQPGSYAGTLTVTDQVTGDQVTVPVTLVISAGGGQVPQNGIVSAASFQGGPVAPGELITIFGTGVGPSTLAGAHITSDGKVDVLVGETRILFDGVPAPLIYVSGGQSSAIVPYSVATQTSTQLQVEYKGSKSNALTVPVAACAPAIFTANSSGKGQGSIANQDYSPNSTGNPAAKGSVITFYATGEGQTDPAGVDGQIASSVYPKPVQPVSVQIGGAAAEVLYAGAAPQAVAGVFQVNARIPDGAASGEQPVVLTVGACSSPAGVTVAVQ